MDGNPGFTKQSLDFLKQKVADSKFPVHVSLLMDDISLKENIYFDGRQFHGGTDFGDVGVLGEVPDGPRHAKEALGMIFKYYL